MEYKRVLLNRTLFNATTQDLNIPADNVKYLDIGIDCHNCGATACTVAAMALAPIDEVRIQLGGEWIINIHWMDLLALNAVWQDILPHALTNAGDANAVLNCKIEGVRLPLHVTKCGKSLSAVFTYLANAAIQPDNLCVSYQYRDKVFDSHFNIQYKEFTVVTAATDQEMNLDYAGAECIGILLYAEVIQITTSDNTTIGEVRLLVDDREVYHEQWETMTKLHMGIDTVSDPTDWGPLFDNYRWIDLQQEPLPAGKLRMLARSLGDTAHLMRIIPVYAQKNQAQ